MPNFLKSFSVSSLIGNPVFIAAVVGLGLYLICLILFFRHKKRSQNFCLALLFMYMAVIAYLAVPIALPSQWHISAKSTAHAIRSIEWIPFTSSSNLLKNAVKSGNYKAFLYIIGGNFGVLMPLGILLPLGNPRFRLGRIAAVAVLVPIGIEGLQLVYNILVGSVVRYVQVEDVILNAAGCLIAYWIFTGLRRLFRPKSKSRRKQKGAS
jgi:glycopeptide antibiotics resistance protein